MAAKKRKAKRVAGEVKAPRGSRIAERHKVYGRNVYLTKNDRTGHVNGYVEGKNGKLLLVVDGSAEAGGTGRALTSTSFVLQKVTHFMNHYPVG